jgi:hypothetical protein
VPCRPGEGCEEDGGPTVHFLGIEVLSGPRGYEGSPASEHRETRRSARERRCANEPALGGCGGSGSEPTPPPPCSENPEGCGPPNPPKPIPPEPPARPDDDFSDSGSILKSVVVGAGTVVITSVVPGAGEFLDVYTLLAPDSTTTDRVLSGVSLLASVLSAGVLPNYGAYVRSAKLGRRVPRALLGPTKVHRHHLLPRAFRAEFKARGINIDDFAVELGETFHLRSIHGRGDLVTPGQYNQRWRKFFEDNPNASAKDIYQFAGGLIDEYGLNSFPIVPFKDP